MLLKSPYFPPIRSQFLGPLPHLRNLMLMMQPLSIIYLSTAETAGSFSTIFSNLSFYSAFTAQLGCFVVISIVFAMLNAWHLKHLRVFRESALEIGGLPNRALLVVTTLFGASIVRRPYAFLSCEISASYTGCISCWNSKVWKICSIGVTSTKSLHSIPVRFRFYLQQQLNWKIRRLRQKNLFYYKA